MNSCADKPKELIGDWINTTNYFAWPKNIVLTKDDFTFYELFSYDFISTGDWNYSKKRKSITFIFKDNLLVWKKFLKDQMGTKNKNIIRINSTVPLIEVKLEKTFEDSYDEHNRPVTNRNKVKYIDFVFWSLEKDEDGSLHKAKYGIPTSKEKWDNFLNTIDKGSSESSFDPRIYLNSNKQK